MQVLVVLSSLISIWIGAEVTAPHPRKIRLIMREVPTVRKFATDEAKTVDPPSAGPLQSG
jgi:hypothetical protein